MIERPTTLIVGAGGSMAYEFPSGRGLLMKICEFLRPDPLSNEKRILVEARFEDDRLEWFRRDLLRSGLQSVDAFLERRNEFIDEGKAAIACALIAHEVPAAVVERHASNNWYEYLWSRIVTEAPEDLSKNQLTILTFNYDRSLEFYLFEAIRCTYGLTVDKVREHINSIPIIHLHGQLGELREITGSGRGFENDRSVVAVRTAARGIIIVHEADDGHETFKTAREKIATSEVVCFLGFGYHPKNLKRLGIADIRKANSNLKLFGTTYSMTEAEYHQVQNIIGFAFPHANQQILDFLRERSVLNP